MSLLGGGSLIYTPPVPEFARYEPTGTWMQIAEHWVTFSNDGINWQKVGIVGGSVEDWTVQRDWVFGAGKMVVGMSAFFSVQKASRMTNTNPVEFTQSAEAPSPDPDPDEENDEYDPSFKLAHGSNGFIGISNQTLRSSGDAEFWNEELPAVTDFQDAGSGPYKFMPEVGLYIRLGSGAFPPDPATYWTSGNGLTWTQRLFPEEFGSTFGGLAESGIMVGNGTDIILVGLHNGRIYRSFDGVNWDLRYNPFPDTSIQGMVWNPHSFGGAGSFFATQGSGVPFTGQIIENPDNLLKSSDGNFWTAVDPNDLVSTFGNMAVDANKNLMVASTGDIDSGADFGNGGFWQSDDDGETWKEFGDRTGGEIQFIDLKIGPVVDETLSIDTGAIVIAESRTDPDVARASLHLTAFNTDEPNGIDENTVLGGRVNLGKWALTLDHLNPFYYEVRLDRTSGDDFDVGSSLINEWTDFSGFWTYFLNMGVDVKTFTGTLRVRHRETLVESNSVAVSMDCEVTA